MTKQQEIRMLFGILIDAYLTEGNELGGRGFRIINDNLDVEITFLKNAFLSRLFRSYRIDNVTKVARHIISKMCAEKNVNSLLLAEMQGFLKICHSEPNWGNVQELILKMYAIHMDIETYRPKKETILFKPSNKTKYVPVFTMETVTPQDIILVETKSGPRSINVHKFMGKFRDVTFGDSNDFRTPEKILEIRRYIDESGEDELNEIFPGSPMSWHEGII